MAKSVPPPQFAQVVPSADTVVLVTLEAKVEDVEGMIGSVTVMYGIAIALANGTFQEGYFVDDMQSTLSQSEVNELLEIYLKR